MIKKILAAALVLASSAAIAEDHERSYNGLDLSQQLGIQFEVCTLKEGKSVEDLAKVDARIVKAFDSLGIELSFLRLTPLYSHATPGQASADYIDMVVGSITEFGSGWDKWSDYSDGEKILSDVADIADCDYKFLRGINKHMNVAAMESTDRRIFTFNWCTAHEGVSYAQLKAKHDSWLAENKDDFQAASWTIIVPRLGGANAPGGYAHMNVFTSATALMDNEDWIANGDGWRGIQDYYTSYASCNGDSAWNAEFKYRRGE